MSGAVNSNNIAGFVVALLQDRVGDVVAITRALLVGVRGRHAVAAVIENAAGEN